ncbi:hypothetical protein [Reinekea thalattae]|uniref:Uncharacterized protein n=1 Tax=Reinekea thalattae TaxID=2593301 RepID=A0A5C8ZB03_9GAMM|nr:hypothetical protein [Reinekea thalattae]TXR54333.1 hypothetical protein FME95_07295 [Reinekea thalattae]
MDISTSLKPIAITNTSSDVTNFELSNTLSNSELLSSKPSEEVVLGQAEILKVQAIAAQVYEPTPPVVSFDFATSAEQPVLLTSFEDKLNVNYKTSFDDLLGGFHSNIGSFLDSGLTELEQTGSKTIFTQTAANFDANSHTDRITESRSKHGGYSTEFRLTTKEGDTLTFNLTLDYSSGSLSDNQGRFTSKHISLSMALEGNLSDEEKQAIEEFASSLDQQIGDIMSGDSVNFDKLNIFSDDIISDISFTADSGYSETFSLKMTNTDDERSISFDSKLVDVDITLDNLSNPLNNNMQQESLLELLQNVKEGTRKARDDDDHSRTLTSAISTIFGDLATSSNSNQAIKAAPNSVSNYSGAITSGLPDFSIDYSSKAYSGSGFAEEKVGLAIKQNTSMTTSDSGFEVFQNYSYELNYSYDKPLPHLKFPTEDLRIEVIGHEQQRRTSHFEVKDGIVINASVSKEASESITENTIRFGELEDSKTTTEHSASVIDITEQAQQALAENEMLVVEDLMEHITI